MNLDVVITQLRERATSFGSPSRIGGAADFEVLPATQSMAVPAAYVIPSADQPVEQSSQNGFRQQVADRFVVVVALSNRTDERGQTAAQSLHAIRAEIFLALLGFQPGADYDAIQYEGGQLLHLDRARLYWQFEFSAGWEIGEEDTFLSVRDEALPPFDGVNLRVDMTEPVDPNLGASGPDGTIDAGADIDLP